MLRFPSFPRLAAACLAAAVFAVACGEKPPAPATTSVASPPPAPAPVVSPPPTTRPERVPDEAGTSRGTAAPASPAPATTVDASTPGSIAGRITLAGEPPAPAAVKVPSDKAADCGHTVPADDLVVDPATKGVRWVVVYVDRPANAAKPEPRAITLDQKDCVFTPHMVFAPVGSTVTFANTDKASHNVNVKALKNRSFNRSMAPSGAPIPFVVDAPEIIQVVCDIHPWMRSYIIVKDHPFVALTDGTGAFKIDGLPPGDYAVKCWHEKTGIQPKEGVKVKVAAGQTATASFPPLEPK